MSRQRLERRLTVLEHSPLAYPRELVAQLAREAGCSESELIAEAEAMLALFTRVGATTWEQRLQIVAEDRGIPVEDLQQELEAMGMPCR